MDPTGLSSMTLFTATHVQKQHPRGVTSFFSRLRPASFFLFLSLLAPGIPAAGAEIRGSPFARSYSLEDVGYVPRGARLNFDSFGRIAVIHDEVYAVLDDSAWRNVATGDETAHTPMTDVVLAGNNQAFYGGRASWGFAEFGSDGKIHAKSLVPSNAPRWIRNAIFDDLLVTSDGVYFASRNGIVFWDFSRKESQFFEMPVRLSKIFAIGNKVFVSSVEPGARLIDIAEGRLRPMPELPLEGTTVERAAVLDETHSLLSMEAGNLAVFDGERLAPWPGLSRHKVVGRVSVLQRLADGNVAIAVDGKGAFVFSPQGDLVLSLTAPQYQQISSIASRERGVLWLLTEDSVEKVFYEGGLTSFGHRLGVTLEWPSVVAWDGRIFVASQGILYEAFPGPPGEPARFERFQNQAIGNVGAITSSPSHLLMGNRSGIYSIQRDGTAKRIGGVRNLTRLQMVGDNQCYAIGPSEIALFEWNGQTWSEPVPRVPGLPNPVFLHPTANAVWVEMGGSGVARVSRTGDRLKVMSLRNETWTKALWVNIGIIGDTAVLSTFRDQRRFFDEKTETWYERPDLIQLFNRSSHWIARVWQDESGTLWATHNEGLVRFTPKGDGYTMDLSTYDLINDRHPFVHIFPGNDIWLSAGRSLHHVEPIEKPITPSSAKPVLVSLMDTHRNVELLADQPLSDKRRQLPFSQNSLMVRFFSGSYAWRRAPVYEFRLKNNEPWLTLDTGSLLRLPALHEGEYDLEVRIAGDHVEHAEPMIFSFEILPPWQRTTPAYALYASILILAVAGINRWFSRLTYRRNRALEELVRNRTSELESTMKKLNEETRSNATLAERDRLAGEIHDSVQQGLSGAIIQLDTTLKLTSLSGELRNRLQVVRNMISYSRQEVQHAVWDLDSPLLENNDLGEALRKLAGFTMPDTIVHSVRVSGAQISLPRSTQHNLLRIAQEATTNSVRHAQARKIDIELEYTANAVALRISDDGIGLCAEDALKKFGHFGLRGIRSRAKKLGGELVVKSAPGEGTRIQVLAHVADTI
jgi:signal transduction histidine kinase